jgi:hypothetical protein
MPERPAAMMRRRLELDTSVDRRGTSPDGAVLADLVGAASDAVKSRADDTEAPEAHALRRWALPLVAMLDAPEDPRTLHEWGRTVGVSTGALRNWCRTARLSARDSLMFGRVLRVVIQQKECADRPEDLLNIVDRRTLAKVLAASGAARDRLPASSDEFFTTQRFIERKDAVHQVQLLMRRRTR